MNTAADPGVYTRDRRFLRSGLVHDQFGLHTNSVMRWRKATGIDPRSQDAQGRGHWLYYTGREVHQLLAYFDVMGHPGDGTGFQKTPVESLRWVWEPVMTAIQDYPNGGTLVAWHTGWGVFQTRTAAAQFSLGQKRLVAVYDITMPKSLDLWLRERWEERQGPTLRLST